MTSIIRFSVKLYIESTQLRLSFLVIQPDICNQLTEADLA